MPKPARRAMRRGLFHGLRLLAAGTAAVAGFSALRPLGRALGGMQYHGTPRRRRRLLTAMRHALPDTADHRHQLRTAYRENTRAVLEVLALYSKQQPDAVIEAACRVDGMDRLRALEGGAILLGTHSGNGVLLPIRLARMGFDVCVAVREAGKIPSGFFTRGLARYGVEALDAGAGNRGLKTMIRALRRGALLYILMDQGSKQGGEPVNFLGQRTHLPAGPAVLARRCRVPVIPAPTVAADPVWRFHLAPPVRPAETVDAGLDVQHLATLSEAQIRAHPELWTWHHRRWVRQHVNGVR